jgi:serine/threonine-protein kinase
MSDTLARLTAALAGRYRVERELGAGGMATVFLAHDEKHGRDVAIKVLHPDLGAALGAERFLAEIRTTAKLQHPHILPLLDSGEADGLLFYVMPYVKGETLRARLARETQLPVADALAIAREVADALAEAHAQGIVHRDIKPENVLLQGGHAIVADFGIALAVQSAGGARMTQTGLSLGTPQYMAPEQAMGDRTIDHRVDQYALAAVTYELLTGEPPHTGPTAQAIVAKLLSEPVRPATVLRPAVPPHVDAALQVALAKLPADRFASVREFAEALRGGSGARVATAGVAPRGQGAAERAGAWFVVASTLVAFAAAGGWLLGRQGTRGGEGAPAVRLALLLPEGTTISGTLQQRGLALSPDGREVIYAATRPGSPTPRLYRQRIDSDSAEAIPGTEGMGQPSLSMDGAWLAATSPTGGTVVIPLRGGTPDLRPVVPASTQTFMAWSPDGTLLVSRVEAMDVLRVDPRTRAVTTAVKVPAPGIWIDQVLPDGQRALGVVAGGSTSTGRGAVLDLRTGAITPLLDMDVNTLRYADGQLLAWRGDGSLFAYPFDPAGGRVTGEAVVVARHGGAASVAGQSQMDATAGGALVYGERPPSTLVLVDRQGRERELPVERGAWHDPQFAPDGAQLAADFATGTTRDVWTIPLGDGKPARATSSRNAHDVLWSRDGRSLFYLSDESGVLGIRRVNLGSAAQAESLYTQAGIGAPSAWMPDGTTLVTVGIGADGALALQQVANGGRGPATPVDIPKGGGGWPAVSPDGRWIAYATLRSGRSEVILRELATGREQNVTTTGGGEPAWSRDGRTLHWRGVVRGQPGEALVAAPVTPQGVDTAAARALFGVGSYAPAVPHRNYDVAPDGQHFAFVKAFEISRVVVVPSVRSLVAGLAARPVR